MKSQAPGRKNRWLDWKPEARIIENTPKSEPTKPTKPQKSDSEGGFVGFVGATTGQFPIIRYPAPSAPAPKDSLEQPRSAPPPETTDRLATCAPTCHEIEPRKWIHRPWDGCTTPMPEWKSVIPSQPDCGCDGEICPRCWLCPNHCHCLPQGTCWHCRGEGLCRCVVCEGAECVACKGSGCIPDGYRK